MRYTQKDIRRLLGLSRDALRLYEQRGIIRPYVDPANGYRWYDDWDVNALWEMRRYQAMGFSLAETQRIQQDEGLAGIRDDVAARRSQLEDDLRYQSLVLDELRVHLTELDRIEEGLGTYTDEQTERLLYLPEREDHDLLLDGASSGAARLVNDNMALFRATFWFPDVAEDRYYWGFAIPARTLEALEIGRDAAARDDVATTDKAPRRQSGSEAAGNSSAARGSTATGDDVATTGDVTVATSGSSTTAVADDGVTARDNDLAPTGNSPTPSGGSSTATSASTVVLPKGVVELPSSPAVSTYVDAGERWHFGIGLFAGLIEEAHRRGIEPSGPLYGFLLARTHDAHGVLHRYVHAFLPVSA